MSIPTPDWACTRTTRFTSANATGSATRARVPLQNLADEHLLLPEPGQERDVYVNRLPWLAPPLKGQAINETGLPPLLLTALFQVFGSEVDLTHRCEPS